MTDLSVRENGPTMVGRTSSTSMWNKIGPKTMHGLNKSLKKVKAVIAQGRQPSMLTDDANASDLDELTEQLMSELASVSLFDAKDNHCHVGAHTLGAALSAVGVRRTVSEDLDRKRSTHADTPLLYPEHNTSKPEASATKLLQGPRSVASAAELLPRPAPLPGQLSGGAASLIGHSAPNLAVAPVAKRQSVPVPASVATPVIVEEPATPVSGRSVDSISDTDCSSTGTTTEPTLAPLTWDAFERIRDIGSGSYGCVTLCKHKASGAPCIIKQVNKAYTFAKHEQQHALNEKDILTKLTESKCPFTAHVYGFFQDADNLYYVLEYVPGGELFTYMVQYDRFDDEEAKFFVAQLALVLQHMHERGIAYRDVKPENMLVDEKGYIKVCDFGFSRVIPKGDRAYTMCGTPEYIAPEILRGKGHGTSPDIWSLGIFAYELLCGRTPFEGGSSRATHVNILNGAVKFPDYVSPLARDFITRLLTLDERARLGCGHDGFAAIFAHPWLSTVDLELLQARKLRAPFDVKITSPFDSHNFDGVPADVRSRVANLPHISADLDILFANFDYVAREFPETKPHATWIPPRTRRPVQGSHGPWAVF